MYNSGRSVASRIQQLESHLDRENPVLLESVKNFRTLDKVAYSMGLLDKEESFATQIPWWPLVSILGTFSAGKSSFINYYLGAKIQRSGNQAVDEKFTVLSYSKEEHTLPGVALDADPRFPFYQISTEIERVSEGEGQRIDTYLQLKTCPSEQLRGKILIDSPGFDADAQRTATLRITDHIVDLSDLVLVFFDARHPEPGAMQDTLKHLVGETIHRPDASKFMYILNQLDTAAKEDNPEDIVGAWQRALAEQGLTAGRFFTIYNPDVCNPIDDENVRKRFETKRDNDMFDIKERMRLVGVERCYRIISALDKTARDIEERIVPIINENQQKWKKLVLIGDSILYGLFLILFLSITIKLDYWTGFSFNPPWLADFMASPIKYYFTAGFFTVLMISSHFFVRNLTANMVAKKLKTMTINSFFRGNLSAAFLKNTKPWRSIFASTPAGWGRGSKKKIQAVLGNIDGFVQTLNDNFTNPSGTTKTPTTEQQENTNPTTEEMTETETLAEK